MMDVGIFRPLTPCSVLVVLHESRLHGLFDTVGIELHGHWISGRASQNHCVL